MHIVFALYFFRNIIVHWQIGTKGRIVRKTTLVRWTSHQTKCMRFRRGVKTATTLLFDWSMSPPSVATMSGTSLTTPSSFARFVEPRANACSFEILPAASIAICNRS